MASRFPMWGKEQVKIEAQFQIEQALGSIVELEDRISSLQNLGRISKSDGEKMKRQLAAMRGTMKGSAKKAKSKKP